MAKCPECNKEVNPVNVWIPPRNPVFGGGNQSTRATTDPEIYACSNCGNVFTTLVCPAETTESHDNVIVDNEKLAQLRYDMNQWIEERKGGNRQ